MLKIRAAIRRWYWLLVLGVVIGAGIGGASASLRSESKPRYEASTVILLDLDRSSIGAQQAAQQAGLRVRRGSVPLRAAQILERNDPDALVANVAVEVESDSLSLTIRAADEDPSVAEAISDAFTTAFLETSNQQELDALDQQIELLERQLAAARARVAAFDAANPLISGLTDTRIPGVQERADLVADVAALEQQYDDTAQQRETTTGPYSRLGEPTVAKAATSVVSLPGDPFVRAALFGVLGFAVAALAIALIERVNPRIDTKQEAQEAMSLPVLSIVPYLGRRGRSSIETITPEHFGGGHAEAYRRLRSAMHFASLHAPSGEGAAARGSSFLIVSASPGEGKTSTVAFAALALAEAELPTVAVNADSRRPTLHRRLGVKPEPGLTELAELTTDRPAIDDLTQPGPVENLWVVSSGQPGPLTTELVGAVHTVIDEATARGATVVVDSSPLLATADVLELLPLVDHVIFVVRQGRTTRAEVRDAMEMLRLRDAPLLGCVCIGSPSSKRRYSYYESYYYENARSAERSAPAAPTDAPATASAPGSTVPSAEAGQAASAGTGTSGPMPPSDAPRGTLANPVASDVTTPSHPEANGRTDTASGQSSPPPYSSTGAER